VYRLDDWSSFSMHLPRKTRFGKTLFHVSVSSILLPVECPDLRLKICFDVNVKLITFHVDVV